MTERIRYGSRGQGSLLKFPNSPHWFSAIRVRGKEVVQTTGTDDLKRARRVHRQRLDEVALDRQGARAYATPAAKRVSVAELLDDLESDWRLRELKSLDKTLGVARAVRAEFGHRRAFDVDAAAVDRWAERCRAEGLSGASVNRRLSVLTGAFKLGRERRRLAEVPRFRKLAEGPPRQGFFSREEFDRLLVVLPAYLRDLVTFAYYTGWRRGELLGLRWDMVRGDSITLPDTKNGRPRTLTLAGEALEVVRRCEAARLLERDGEPVVASHVFHNRGRAIKDFDHAWRRALREAGLIDKIFHDLRRTGVRNMIHAGVPEVTAMSISGHKTRSMLDRYSIVSGEDQRAAMEKVSQ